MKFSRDCGLSFKAWSILTVLFELLSAVAVAAITVWAYFLKAGKEFRLTYSPTPSTNYVVKHHTYEVVVISWIVVMLLCLCFLRFLAAIVLAVGIKRNSAEMSKVWIAFKVFALTISLFLVVGSFSVSLLAKVATLAALITDLLSSYFIRLLYPELEKMRRFIKMDVDPAPTAEKQ